MNKAKMDAAGVPRRARHAVTVTNSASTADTADAGPMRSFVGLYIPEGLNDGSLTFYGAPPSDDLENGETTPTLVAVDVEPDGTGADRAAFTLDHSTTTGYLPLPPSVFNGLRHLQVISSVAQTGKDDIILVSKPV